MRFVRSLAVIMMFSVFLPCLTYTGEAFALGDKSPPPPPPPPLPQPPPPPPPPPPQNCEEIKDQLLSTLNGNFDEVYEEIQNQREAFQNVVNDYQSGAYSCEENPRDAALDAIDNETSTTVSDLLDANEAAIGAAEAAAAAAGGCSNIDFGWLKQENDEMDWETAAAITAAHDEAYAGVLNTEPPVCSASQGAPASDDGAGVMDAGQDVGACEDGVCIPN